MALVQRKRPIISAMLFFPVHECKVSEWGPWSPCSVRCGSGGFTERHRVILHQPSNGGSACPHLVQAKPCSGRACDEDEPEERWTGTWCCFHIFLDSKAEKKVFFLEGLSTSSSTMPSLTTQKSGADNGTGIDESRPEVFHTLVASSSVASAQESYHQASRYVRH